jgi:hypothetical protein
MSWPIVDGDDDISPPNTNAAVVASGDQPTMGRSPTSTSTAILDLGQRWRRACHVERLYAVAVEDHPGSAEFLHRMAWLPALLADLDQPVPLDRAFAQN